MEMVHSGHGFFPSFVCGELYPDKPLIFIGRIALFYWLTGSINIAFLYFPAVIWPGHCLLVYSLGRSLWTKPNGFLCRIILIVQCAIYPSAKNRPEFDGHGMYVGSPWVCYGLVRFFTHRMVYGRWYYMPLVFYEGSGVLPKVLVFCLCYVTAFFALITYI